jgi:dienelactone hydrolase
MWAPDEYLEKLYEQLERRRFDQAAGFDETKERLKDQLAIALGGFPVIKAPFAPILLEQVEHEDYRLERVEYTSVDGMRVPAYVLIPKSSVGPFPAVLACHGHGYGSKEAIGLDPQGKPLADFGIHNRFAVELVRRGMMVIIPEILGFGDRRLQAEMDADPFGLKTNCYPIAVRLLMYGKTLAGIRVHEAMRALDYLETRIEVDINRMGILGFSGGGLIASFTAALDERIRAAVLCGYTNTFKDSIMTRDHCIDNYIPGILLHGEQPDLIGLISPRPLFIESGEEDQVFPIAGVKEALEKLKIIYRSFGAESQLASDLFPGDHEIKGRKAFDWLKGQLS